MTRYVHTPHKSSFLKAPLHRSLNVRQRRALERNLAAQAIKARWCIDIKYGVKMEAISLMQDWIKSVGSQAGLSEGNTNLLSGAVGASESRLELEVEFETLALLEGFWAAIPPAEHKAWSQRARNFIIDGSPRWEIYRTCPTAASREDPSLAAAPEADPVKATLKAWESATTPRKPSSENAPSILEEYLREPTKEPAPDQSLPQSPLWGADSGKSTTDLSGRRIATDWKGDPMIINPGDNMPLF